jgi:hypothetical protein
MMLHAVKAVSVAPSVDIVTTPVSIHANGATPRQLAEMKFSPVGTEVCPTGKLL